MSSHLRAGTSVAPSFVVSTIFALCVFTASTAQGQACVGDCNDECTVAINELIQGVRISLGTSPISACPNFDGNASGEVEVNELIQGVRNSLNGCPETCSPDTTPRPTETADPVGSPTPRPTVDPNATPTTIAPTPNGGLVLAGASATDSSSIVVDFNGVIDGASGLNPTNYQIVQEETSANGPRILSVQFVLQCDGGEREGESCNETATGGPGCPGGSCSREFRRAVVLTTSTLAEIPYKLTVTGVRDTAGTTIVVRDLEQRRTNEAMFAGPPLIPIRHCPATTAAMTLATGLCRPTTCVTNDDCPTGDFCVNRIQDCDGDGLDDDTEARGWTVRIRGTGDEILEERIVTSDPFEVDSDNDGLTDDEEQTANASGSQSHPRRADTDGDGLDDFHEVILLRINPSDTDTDDDGIPDGLEIDGRSAAHRADTDGDGILDGNDTTLRSRQLADMPLYDILIENTQVTLDYMWELLSENSTLMSEGDTESMSLTQETSMETRNVAEQSTEWWASLVVKAKATYKAPFSAGFEASVEAEAGIEARGKATSTQTEAMRAAEAHERTNQNSWEVRRGQTERRALTGATIRTDVRLVNTGVLAMTIEDIELTARMQNPASPGEFVTLGTLRPENTDISVTIGPLSTTSGIIAFTESDLGARGPEFIDHLFRNPSSLFISVSNFSLSTEEPPAPNYVGSIENEIVNNTAQILVDFGGASAATGSDPARPVQRIFASTQIGGIRALRDTNGDGVLDPEVVRFDLDGNGPIGPTLADALTFSGLDFAIDPESGKVTEVAGVAQDFASGKEWIIVSQADEGGNDPLMRFDPTLRADEVELSPRRQTWLIYVQDLDLDGVPRRVELLFGSSDFDPDSDDDGVGDFEEIYETYDVEIVELGPNCPDEDTSISRSNPILPDTDLDGLTDFQERIEMGTAADRVDTDCDYLPDNRPNSPTDEVDFGTNPLDADTDDDGETDGFRCEARDFVFTATGIQFTFNEGRGTNEYAWPDTNGVIQTAPGDPDCSVTVNYPGGFTEGSLQFPWQNETFELVTFEGYQSCVGFGGQDNLGCSVTKCFCDPSSGCSAAFVPPQAGFCPPDVFPDNGITSGRPECSFRDENDIFGEASGGPPEATFTVRCQ